jgi:hypothetical protein
MGDYSLKRLASAVQLRPWPPRFQSVALLKKTLLGAIGGNFFARPESARSAARVDFREYYGEQRYGVLNSSSCARDRRTPLPACT